MPGDEPIRTMLNAIQVTTEQKAGSGWSAVAVKIRGRSLHGQTIDAGSQPGSHPGELLHVSGEQVRTIGRQACQVANRSERGCEAAPL